MHSAFTKYKSYSHIIKADGQVCIHSQTTVTSHTITLAPTIMHLNDTQVHRHLDLLFDLFTSVLAVLMHAFQRHNLTGITPCSDLRVATVFG